MQKLVLVFSFATLTVAPALAADPAAIDWAKIPAVGVTLFYPGHPLTSGCAQAVIPVRSPSRREWPVRVATQERKRRSGDKIVKGGSLEPVPVKGKNGTVDLKVQAAYDAKNPIFASSGRRESVSWVGTQYLRFDRSEWKVYGYPKLDKVVQDGAQPGIYEDRMTIMIDDGRCRYSRSRAAG